MDEPLDSTYDSEEFRAPTVPEVEAGQIKYNYQEAFERPGFLGTCDVAIFTTRGHPMIRNGRHATRTVIRQEGVPKEALLFEKNLD